LPLNELITLYLPQYTYLEPPSYLTLATLYLTLATLYLTLATLYLMLATLYLTLATFLSHASYPLSHTHHPPKLALYFILHALLGGGTGRPRLHDWQKLKAILLEHWNLFSTSKTGLVRIERRLIIKFTWLLCGPAHIRRQKAKRNRHVCVFVVR